MSMTIEEYAIDLAVDGIRSLAEDDLNEDGAIAEEDHEAACNLALAVARAVAAHADQIVAWAWQHTAEVPE